MTTFFYDRTADVFYLTLGDPQPAISGELDDDVLLRVHPDSGAIVGLTILNFAERFGELSNEQVLPFRVELFEY